MDLNFSALSLSLYYSGRGGSYFSFAPGPLNSLDGPTGMTHGPYFTSESSFEMIALDPTWTNNQKFYVFALAKSCKTFCHSYSRLTTTISTLLDATNSPKDVGTWRHWEGRNLVLFRISDTSPFTAHKSLFFACECPPWTMFIPHFMQCILRPWLHFDFK